MAPTQRHRPPSLEERTDAETPRVKVSLTALRDLDAGGLGAVKQCYGDGGERPALKRNRWGVLPARLGLRHAPRRTAAREWPARASPLRRSRRRRSGKRRRTRGDHRPHRLRPGAAPRLTPAGAGLCQGLPRTGRIAGGDEGGRGRRGDAGAREPFAGPLGACGARLAGAGHPCVKASLSQATPSRRQTRRAGGARRKDPGPSRCTPPVA